MQQELQAEGLPVSTKRVARLMREDGLAARLGDEEDARRAIFRYIETSYNRKRWHSTLGYVSPTECEEQLEEAA
ncbi:hypothetical protein BH09GEM1_BH09GEM1_01830 [soil metagenome]